MAQKINAWEETKQALKWIMRSGALTIALTALVSLVQSLQENKIDVRFFIYGIIIIVLKALINTVDFYMHERKAQ